jgi:hypothetical protein
MTGGAFATVTVIADELAVFASLSVARVERVCEPFVAT